MQRSGFVPWFLGLSLLAGCVSTPAVTGDGTDNIEGALSGHANAAAVCPGPATDGEARCHAWVGTDAKGQPLVGATYSTGLRPADLQAAYALPSTTAGTGVTVAVVDAYDYPSAEADLAAYRTQFGLPPCTTANGCFRKVNQSGVAGSYPKANAGWALEAALDIEMVSAACPKCKIVLVEANSNSMANLGAAVNTAVLLGAKVVSNSYGGNEYSGEIVDEGKYFKHPGVVLTVSSGDSGYGAEFPAASQYVSAVGGTTLTKAGNARGWSEVTWSGSGSGCSAYVGKPTWQTDTGCGKRTIADLAAVANPATGVAVYDTTKYQGRAGWWVVGGTSASAPLVGAMYALAGNTGTVTYGSYPYSHTTAFYDIVSGGNGSCGGTYLCTALAGYDGPTGNGAPAGVSGL